MKDVVKSVMPPVVWQGLRFAKSQLSSARLEEVVLFDGREEFLSELLLESDCYGEYGVGQSTIWVDRFTNLQVLAVDSSQAWIDLTLSKVSVDRHDLKHVDIGDLGEWGRPVTFERREFFSDYISSIWTRDTSPDLVLIDGRFRVACFLECLQSARQGTKIVFDDYVSRKEYHVVEEFLIPVETKGEQALFVVPKEISRHHIADELIKFTYVVN